MTEPTTPPKPTAPALSTEPTALAAPAAPRPSAEPAAPAEPTAAAVPVAPTALAAPAEATAAAVPVAPTALAEPAEPTAPAEPAAPTAPAALAEPAAPAARVAPTPLAALAEPTAAAAPAEPTALAAPAEPTALAAPAEATAAAAPVAPTALAEPTEPRAPAALAEPTAPAAPSEPTAPAAPSEATAAAAPAEPMAPTARAESPAPTPPAESTAPTPPAPVGAPAPSKDRRILRAALRWTAVVCVFAAAWAGTAYGVAGMERTDVPGLATESDGRWAYPELTRPPLPSGSPGPFAEGNDAGTHHADLRALVLPAPRGATETAKLRGSDGWLATEDFLAEFPFEADRDTLRLKLADAGLRHIAARGWTTEDGTRTRVYLLRFGTAEVVDDLMHEHLVPDDYAEHQVRGTALSVFDEGLTDDSRVDGVGRSVQVEPEPYGREQVRHAYLGAGDVLALVVQSGRGATPALPFHQTITLQSQLLT